MSAGGLDRQQAQVMRAVRQAGNSWADAMRAHKLAPPDAGFYVIVQGWKEQAVRLTQSPVLARLSETPNTDPISDRVKPS